MNKFVILRGIPGSGKSFLANKLCQIYYAWGPKVVSTDNYWLRPDGVYDFNPKLLGKAHEWAFEKFKEEIEAGRKYIILDNTNTQWKEFEKYVTYALENGYEVEVKEPDTPWKFDVEECFKRNSHGVPKETIQKMLDRWHSSEWIQEKIGGLSE